MIFFIVAIAGMYVGRKTGWRLSRAFLYTSPIATSIVVCVLWGGLIAWLVHMLIMWQQPYWILKWIFGFALGAYVAIPNFGLIAEATVPADGIKRHEVVSHVPLWSYILVSVGFAFF